jgi:hypothetical protein
MYVVQVDRPTGEPDFRAFESEAPARQSLNAGCWKVFRAQALAAFLFVVPGESTAGAAIVSVKGGGGLLIARDLQDGMPPNAYSAAPPEPGP